MPQLLIYRDGKLVQATAAEAAEALAALGAAAAGHTHAELMTASERAKLANLPDADALDVSLAGKASLIAGKLAPDQVPDIALQQYLGAVATEAAMLALVGQAGDWCSRSDTGTDWRIVGDPSTLAGWLQTSYPSAPVSSVNGKSGAVVLTPADIGSVRQDDLGPLALMTLPEAQAAVSGALWVQRAWGAGAPVLAPYTGAPTVTIGGATTSISGGTVVAANSASLSYLGQTFAAFSTTYIYAAGGRLTTVEFWTDAPQLDLSMLRYNTKAVLYVDGRVAATPFSFDAAGSAQFVNVKFESSQVRRIELRGVNMPFGGLVLPAGYTAWQMPEYRRPVIFVTGDSYVFGNASDTPAWSWAGVMAEWLGMSVAVDGVGSTGWNSTAGNVPATRAAATTGCNAIGRYSAGVTNPITPAANLVALGYNDAPAIGTGSNAQTCAAAIDAFYAACTVKPLFVGPWTPAGGNANITTVRGIIQARAAALGAKFVDTAGIITTANWAAYNSGDNVHPNQAGHGYIGMVEASRIAAAMRS